MRITSFLLLFFVSISLQAQDALADLLKLHNEKHIPYISVNELAMPKTDALILDAREFVEYEVSHIPNAIFVGYNDFKLSIVEEIVPDKNKTIVVYCSIGIRSENISSELKKAGYSNVFNLYGGIFEWKNNLQMVYDAQDKVTNNVHVFSRQWAKWLKNGNPVY